MRRSLPWLVCAVLSASTALAQSKPATATGAAVPAAHQKAYDWYVKNFVDAYERIGRKNPKWDAAAREVLRARAVGLAASPNHSVTRDESDTVWFAFKRAREAGCDDPLVVYSGARVSDTFARKLEEFAPLYFEAARNVVATDYHPMVKAYCLLRAAETKRRFAKAVPTAMQEADALLDQAGKYLAQTAADPTVSRSELVDLFGVLTDASKSIKGDGKTAWLAAYEPLIKTLPDQGLLLTLQARFSVDYAWEARGSGYANTVKAEGWELFGERLDLAVQAGEAAFAADPHNPEVCLIMMTAELGRGKGIAELDKWFNRAVAADPGCSAAYDAKLQYLEPKWYGNTVDDMITFAREASSAAVAAGQWDAGVPLIIVAAHLDASHYRDGSPKSVPQTRYFRGNETVWKDIQAVYPEYIKRYPDSLYHRSRYAQLAIWCGHPQEAREQFDHMGKRFSYGWFRNDATYAKAVAAMNMQLVGSIPAAPEANEAESTGQGGGTGGKR
jgi:hypothetical protein